MNLPKFPHSAMFVGVTACGKTEFLLRLLETIYKSHFEFIVILCPTILDNKTYLSRKWIFDDKNVFVVCDIEGKLNEWIKLFKNALKGHQTLFIIDDCSAEGEINKKRDALSELAFSGKQDLSDDLECDPFLNTAMQRFTCDLYYRFGTLLAPVSVGIITGKHYAKNSITKLNGRSNSGNCDPAKSRDCNQTEEPSES